MKKINHLLSARKTLMIEAKGIENLSKNLSKEFNEVCDSLLKAKGKIFTLGIGKSGHIAKKISGMKDENPNPKFVFFTRISIFCAMWKSFIV